MANRLPENREGTAKIQMMTSHHGKFDIFVP